MTSINLLLSNIPTRIVCQGCLLWHIYYPLVNWTVFSVGEILYFSITCEMLMVNIKYKFQTLNILCHYLILKIHVTKADEYGMFLMIILLLGPTPYSEIIV